MKKKLNVGASPIWRNDEWYILDHKVSTTKDNVIVGEAKKIPLDDGDCQLLFCSHMIEHIPHIELGPIFSEFNRVLEMGGIVRILSPDLFILAKAYVEKDEEFFKKVLSEDENVRTDLGMGGMLMNLIVSPGQDTALFNRQLNKFISGYGHIYLYDFDMLNTILSDYGFEVTRKQFCESEIEDFHEPLHVQGLEPVWQDLNQAFYKKNDLVHYYDEKDGRYNINFTVTGFDRDPLMSLIVEAKKVANVSEKPDSDNDSQAENYNRYGNSLLKDKKFATKVKLFESISKVIDEID